MAPKEIVLWILQLLSLLNINIGHLLWGLIQPILMFFKWNPVGPPPLMDNGWRTIDLKARDKWRRKLRELELCNPAVKQLRILIHGPVGAGKSSYINSIDSIFQGCITSPAIAATASDCSFTKILRTHRIRSGPHGAVLPFVMCDMMGLERGEKQGVHTDDIIKVLHGNLKDGYQQSLKSHCVYCSSWSPPGGAVWNYTEFSAPPVCEDELDYFNESPTLDDKVHCLVSVVSANTVTLLDDSVVQKIKTVRLKASNLGIPQVVVLTHVDQACPHVIDKLENVYRSRKIKEKMEVCSNRLGVPMTCIFPVKNYHEEVELEGMVDTLLLHSFKQIVTLGNNYISTLTDIKMENDKGTGERGANSLAHLLSDLNYGAGGSESSLGDS